MAARAQQPAKTVGFLGANSAALQREWTAVFVERLRELGWMEGRNLAIEYRWADTRFERSPDFVAEFIQRKVDVIVTNGTANVIAAKQGTSVIPIVFAAVGDPVGTGLVASLARPGGNVTGLSQQLTDTAGKRLELLREAVPGLRRLAILVNPSNPSAFLERNEVQQAARTFGLQFAVFEIQRVEDIAPAFEVIKVQADALYICLDPLLNTNRVRIGTLAVAARVPTMLDRREFVEAGGLMSYGPNIPALYRRAAELADKILRGTKPAEIPVEQPTKFDLVVNLITAKAIGLTIPETFLVRATEVIE